MTEVCNSHIDSPQPRGDNAEPSTAQTVLPGDEFTIQSKTKTTKPASTVSETLSFDNLELRCPIVADDICNRWLNSYVPVPGQQIKQYPAAVTAYIYKILRSYATAAVRGRGVPPFIHHSQIMTSLVNPPLATCLTLVRMCEKLLPGSESVAADVLRREMTSIYQQRAAYDNMTLLAAYQSYLIYSMIFLFILRQNTNSFLRQALIELQDLAGLSSQHGIVCIAEQERARPRWEAWIVAEAKRRTLFTMYLFDSLLCAQDNLPTFLGTELRGLPAPANKRLWRAQTRSEWETAYNVHLADWVRGGFNIDELWPNPAPLDNTALLEKSDRVGQWLENIDEFGTMLYAVTSCTHGG
ncbi:hypothetical protein ABEF95_006146 [Exophiala dermatitidis]